ncbi:MAG: FKBP-type peptidyl-prolyl cis-trans isomerase [Chitinophagaceae bacterium]|nr:FKBP-type peptidyl-prolyl cis-trans isomerase [Chitinophagaceae bacterium]
MKYSFIFFCMILMTDALGFSKDSSIMYPVPDSIKVIGFLTRVHAKSVHPKKENNIGIKADEVSLFMEADKKEKEIELEFPEDAVVVATGVDVKQEKGELVWNFNWNLNEDYQLMLSTATDSAANFILYSGYVYFPSANKWKLIGTCKISGRWGTVKTISTFYTNNKLLATQFNRVWLQRNNGSWKNLLNEPASPPVINPMSNIDSTAQATKDEATIQQLIKENKTDAVNLHESVYYTILKEGTGRQVKVTDTVTVFYKGSLLIDGSVFDQTKEKPATFPLARLIKGWQIGVPLLKVGGKIKIIIPSGLSYGIRTRAAKIPPNSILVFEVEVVEAKLSRGQRY